MNLDLASYEVVEEEVAKEEEIKGKKRRPFGGGSRARNRRIRRGSTWKRRRKKEPLDEEEEEVVVYAGKGDMLKLKPLLNIQQCTFHPLFETQTTSPPMEQAKNVSFTPKMVELRPFLNNPRSVNLRTNFFQQGKDDGELPWGHPWSLNKTMEGSKEDPKFTKYGDGQSSLQCDHLELIRLVKSVISHQLSRLRLNLHS